MHESISPGSEDKPTTVLPLSFQANGPLRWFKSTRIDNGWLVEFEDGRGSQGRYAMGDGDLAGFLDLCRAHVEW